MARSKTFFKARDKRALYERERNREKGEEEENGGGSNKSKVGARSGRRDERESARMNVSRGMYFDNQSSEQKPTLSRVRPGL